LSVTAIYQTSLHSAAYGENKNEITELIFSQNRITTSLDQNIY